VTTPIAILLSGRGSNFLALHEAIEAGNLPARIVLVLSNVEDAPGIGRARAFGLTTAVVPHRDFRTTGGRLDRQAHESAVITRIEESGAEWVCLAGYMRLLSPAFVQRFPQRIVNIHPSLLPAFPGLDAQKQAWEYGVRVAGCTVHLVDDGLDSGPIIHQRAVVVEPSDCADRLAQKILREEHRAYPEALRWLLETPWRLEGRRIVTAGEESSEKVHDGG
jgi:phosphoribosylglycinamide formyltransferase-1